MRSVILTTLILITASGCMPRQGQSPFSAMRERAHTVRADQEPIVLEANGAVSVQVESFNGDVTIEVDEESTQAHVSVVAQGTHGWKRKKEARASLAEVTCSADLVPDGINQRLRVTATTSGPEPHFQRAHLHIVVPGCTGASVNTHVGNVIVKGVAGPTDIKTYDGHVIVATTRPMTSAVTVNVENEGNVYYRVRGESTGMFDCRSTRGESTSNVRFGTYRILSGTSPKRLRAQLNEGSNPISLATEHGDVRVTVIEDPESYGMFILD